MGSTGNKSNTLDDDRDILKGSKSNSGVFTNGLCLPGHDNHNGSREYLEMENSNYSRARKRAERISDTTIRESMVAAIDIGEDAEVRGSAISVAKCTSRVDVPRPLIYGVAVFKRERLS